MNEVRILVLDSNLLQAKLLTQIIKDIRPDRLSGCSIKVHAPPTPAENNVRETIASFKPHLVITAFKDFGRSTVRLCRDSYPSIPVWIYSGYTAQKLHQWAPEADLILPKSSVGGKAIKALVSEFAADVAGRSD